MPEIVFKGKEYVYNHHLTVPYRPLLPHLDKGIGPGDLAGNLIVQGDNLHALKSLMPRHAGAVTRGPSLVAEIPVHIFRRAAGRSGKAEIAERLERGLQRSATLDLLRTLAVTRDLPPRDLDVLLDAVSHRRVERGQTVYRQGDLGTELFLIAEGLVQIQSEDGDRVHVRAYLSRGDFFGDEELGLSLIRI